MLRRQQEKAAKASVVFHNAPTGVPAAVLADGDAANMVYPADSPRKKKATSNEPQWEDINRSAVSQPQLAAGFSMRFQRRVEPARGMWILALVLVFFAGFSIAAVLVPCGY